MDIIKFKLEELKKNLNGFSCYILGRSYDLEENGATENFKEALKYYKEGMKLNYPLCEYSLGISLIQGLGDELKIDKEKGTKLLIDAYPKILNIINNQNLSLEERIYAKFATGAYTYYGLGNIKKNDKKAFDIIQECANEGHIAAIYDLGANFYYNGVGTEQDIEKAKYYLSIASEAGLPRAIKKYNEMTINNIKTPKELLIFMSKKINYGYLGKNGRIYHYDDSDFNSDWYEQYILESKDEILKYLYGNCWDQVELERYWFLKKKYKIKTIYEMVKLDYDNKYPSHSFLVYQDKDDWYWFENADFNNKGIHKFNTFDELLNYQYNKYVDFLKTFNITNNEIEKIIVTEFDRPKEHISAEEYFHHVIDSKQINFNKKCSRK